MFNKKNRNSVVNAENRINTNASARRKSDMAIIFKSNDVKSLNETLVKFNTIITESGGQISHIVRLPNRKTNLVSLNRSPHVYNCHKDQYKLSEYKALLYVLTGTHTANAFSNTLLASGVDFKIKINVDAGAKHE